MPQGSTVAGLQAPRMAAMVRRFLLVAVRVVGVYTHDRAS
jgi:hypothetical protein